jgi:hypothetical protein
MIRPPDRLTYAPAVELRYLGEMAELDHVEPANMYLSLRIMETALLGAGIGGGVRHTSKLKVLNYKRPCKAQMLMNGKKKFITRRHDSTNIMPSLLSQEVRYQKEQRFSRPRVGNEAKIQWYKER